MLGALLATKSPLDVWSPTPFAAIALFLPLAAFVIILSFTIDSRRTSAWLSIVLTAGALAGALLVLAIEVRHPLHLERNLIFIQFFTGDAGDAAQFKLDWGLVADPLAAIGLVLVAAVSLLAQVYALASLRGDSGFVRFFAFMALATFALAGFVVSTSFFQLVFFSVLVSVTTSLLVGHAWRNPQAAAAAGKALFIMILGDAALVVGTIYIFFRFHELNVQALASQWTVGKASATGLLVMALLVFGAAAAKAAQVPLQVWLPDATEGPPPALALIHAVTTAMAGVFLVARSYALFHASPRALVVVAVVGGGTAAAGALWALAQDSLRRLLAYATISEIGLTFLALGIGGYGAAVFQVSTHAWSKALLFMAAGALVLAMRTDNIWEMGGAWRRMPLTAWTTLVAAGAAAAIPPLSGFWSKDAILAVALDQRNPGLVALVVAVTFLSALYLFRMFFAVFSGITARRRRFDPEKVRDPGGLMTFPMVLLAIVSAGAGLWRIPGLKPGLLTFATFPGLGVPKLTGTGLALTATPAVLGLLLAWVLYGWRRLPALAVDRRLGWGYRAFRDGFYIDRAYRTIVDFGLLGVARTVDWVDRRLVDGFVDRFGESMSALSRLQMPRAGRLPEGAFGLILGVLGVAVLTLALSVQAIRRLTGGP